MERIQISQGNEGRATSRQQPQGLPLAYFVSSAISRQRANETPADLNLPMPSERHAGLLNDWGVIPKLLRAAGVAEVSNFGGLVKQFTINFRPADLDRYGLTLNDIVDAVQANNTSSGGSVLQRGSMSFVIRGSGALQDQSQIENIFVKSVRGTPVYLHDVASVDLGNLTPSGIFSKNELDEGVEGIVPMRRGENPSRVLANVQDAVVELNKADLPPGVQVRPFYDREHLWGAVRLHFTKSIRVLPACQRLALSPTRMSLTPCSVLELDLPSANLSRPFL